VLTLTILRHAGVLVPWSLPGNAIGERTFLHTPLWTKQFNRLPGGISGPGLRYRPGFRESLATLISQFVGGTKKSHLIRPFGEGSEPIFKRMRGPNECVAEFRTWNTRTFGFFSGTNTFVAIAVGETTVIKEQKLYEEYALEVQRYLGKISTLDYDCKRAVDELFTD
jgi:hypothetical protein